MAINIYKTEDIDDYLRKMAEKEEPLATLLIAALKKPLLQREESARELKKLPADAPEWLVNKFDVCLARGETFHKFSPDAQLNTQVGHVYDWLKAAQQNGETFTIDKLQKLGSLDASVVAANKYFTAQNHKNKNVFEDDADTKTVMTFEDGSRIVQLLTTKALRREGPAMNHCIGGGGYDRSLRQGICTFYSLRDEKNQPHATFQVMTDNNSLHQCKGKGNQPPIQKYMPMVSAFIMREKFNIKESVRHTGIIRASDGQYFNIYDPPETLSIEGNLDLSGCTNLKRLPQNLFVSGDLSLRDCHLLTGLSGNISARNIYVGIYNESITSISGNISVADRFTINNCYALKTITGSINSGDSLSIRDLPALTSITGSISSRDDISIKNNPALACLYPRSMRTEGNISIDNCPALVTISGNMTASTRLAIGDCPALISLSANIEANDRLYLDDSLASVTEISGKISSSDRLDLKGLTALETLSADIDVKNTLCMDGLKNLTTISGKISAAKSIYLDGCSSLTTLPEDMTVGEYLDLRNCTSLKSIPSALKLKEGGSIWTDVEHFKEVLKAVAYFNKKYGEPKPVFDFLRRKKQEPSRMPFSRACI